MSSATEDVVSGHRAPRHYLVAAVDAEMPRASEVERRRSRGTDIAPEPELEPLPVVVLPAPCPEAVVPKPEPEPGESAPAGSTLHAVAVEGVPIHAVAEVIGRHLGLPMASVSPDDAAGHFSRLSRPAGFLGMDGPASSAHTRELVGCQPTQPGLIDDLDKGHYFATPSA